VLNIKNTRNWDRGSFDENMDFNSITGIPDLKTK
jgi:hypothetical protein